MNSRKPAPGFVTNGSALEGELVSTLIDPGTNPRLNAGHAIRFSDCRLSSVMQLALQRYVARDLFCFIFYGSMLFRTMYDSTKDEIFSFRINIKSRDK